MRVILASLFAFFLTSCAAAPVPKSDSWHQQYQYLNYTIPENSYFTEVDYFIIFLVDAQHLDYSDSGILFKAVSNIDKQMKRSRVGHSWVYLKGIKNGKTKILEGGQSLGFGKGQAGFVDGVLNFVNYGYAYPTEAEQQHYRYEPNPIKHLWYERDDGKFQKGSGPLTPTFAAKVNLTEAQFDKVWTFMDKDNYPYGKFSITGNQCSSFLAKVGKLVGVELEHSVSIDIPPEFTFNGKNYHLWEDPQFSKLTFSTPDVLERSLIHLVEEGNAEYALTWYLNLEDEE